MANFAPMMSAENPYAEPAANAADAGLTDLVQLLRAHADRQQAAAKNQQATQAAAAKDAKERFDAELNLRKEGYTPYDVPPLANGQPTLQTPEGADAPPERSRMITDPYGRQWVAPSAKPAATLQQQFEDTNSIEKEGGRLISPEGNVQQNTNVPRFRQDEQGNVTDTGMFGTNGPVEDQSRVRTVPGTDQKYYIPTPAEKTAESDRAAASKTRAEEGEKNYTLPDSVSAKLEQKAGLPAGSLKGVSVPHSQLLETLKSVVDPASKPDATQFIPGMTGPHGGPMVFDKNTQTASEVALPAGSKRTLSPEAADVAQRAAEREQDRADAAQAKMQAAFQARHDKLQTEEQRQWDVKTKAGANLQTLLDHTSTAKDGSVKFTGAPVQVPDANGKPVAVSDQNLKSLTSLYRYAASKAEQRALDSQGKARKIRQQFGWGEFEKQGPGPGGQGPGAVAQVAPAETPATAPPASAQAAGEPPATQAAKPAEAARKSTTLAKVRAYAKEKGISEAAAVKEYRGYGYQIGN
jgi:hypothetical protein